MAKKRISKDDVAPKTIFDNVKEGANAAKVQIDLLTTAVNALKSTAQTIKNTIPKGSPTSTKGMKDFDNLAKKANETAKAKLNIDKKILVQKESLRVANAKQNKLIKETVALEKAEIGSLKRLRLESKKLRDEKERLNLSTKKGTRRLKEINTQLNKNNEILRRNATELGKQKQDIGKYGKAVGKLRGSLAQLGLAFGVFSILRNVFTTVRDFEQGQADLAAVLDVNTDEMKGLTDQAKELGSTTTFTASQVLSLSKELAKLGFTQDQIQNMTKATLQLAEATGTELGEAATVVGGNLRAFNLASNETQRVVDVMAKAFSSSSLDMTKFSTAMAVVAPVANAMGISIEKTTALVGTLTDNNVDASTAGTGLRNMMLDAKKAGLTLDQALAKINSSSDKVGESFKLFGKRGATLGVILAGNTEATAKLNTQLLFADGSAKAMADTQRDTLGGAIKLLTSAWEGLVLKFEEGTGVFGGLKDVIAFVADNLEDIVKGLVVLGTALGVYKLIVKTEKAFKALSLAMSANPIGLIIAAAAAAAVAISAFAGAMSEAEQAAETLKEVELEAAKATVSQEQELKKLVETAQDKTKTDEQREKAIKAINAISPEMLGNITQENILTEDGSKIIGDYVRALRKKAMAEAINAKLVELNIEILEAQNTSIRDNVTWYELMWQAAQDGAVGFDELVESANKKGKANRKASVAGIEAEIEALLKKAKMMDEMPDTPLDGIDEDPNGTGGGGGGAPKKVKDLQREIRDEQIKQIEDQEHREKTAAATASKRRIKDLDKQKLHEEQKAELIKEIDESLVMDLNAIGKKFDKMRQDRQDKEDKEAKDKADKVRQSIIDANKAEFDQLEAMFKLSLRKKELELLKSGATQEEISDAMLQFEVDQLVKRIELYKQIFPELEDTILGFEIELEKKRMQIAEGGLVAAKENAEDLKELKQQAIEATTDLLVDQIDKRIKEMDRESDAARKQADLYMELAANGNITAKESLAEQNKIIQQAEAEKERLEKRKQQYLLVSSILQSYNSNLEAGDDSTTALTKAITSKAALDQFIAGIGSFFDGTEDTGTVSGALDSNGGRFAVLHDNERVMNAKQNARIGDYSNEQVARVMENHRIGKVVDGNQIGSGWDNELIVNELMAVGDKLDRVNSNIENQESNSIELGDITQSTMKIIETHKKGRNRTTSTYKVKI